LVLHFDELESQDQRTKVKVTRDKNALSSPSLPAAAEWNALAQMTSRSAAADGTIPSLLGDDFGGLACGVCLVKHL